jgi:hypothetical protein
MIYRKCAKFIYLELTYLTWSLEDGMPNPPVIDNDKFNILVEMIELEGAYTVYGGSWAHGSGMREVKGRADLLELFNSIMSDACMSTFCDSEFVFIRKDVGKDLPYFLGGEGTDVGMEKKMGKRGMEEEEEEGDGRGGKVLVTFQILETEYDAYFASDVKLFDRSYVANFCKEKDVDPTNCNILIDAILTQIIEAKYQ